MSTIGILVLLLLLFYLIGRAADWVIINIKVLGKNLGLKEFWLGLILGLLTTSPELFVGLQATLQNFGALSFGNLMGGVVVLLGLICGLSVVLNRELKVAESFSYQNLFIMGTYLLLPLALGSDGQLSAVDGLLLLILYVVIVWYFIKSNTSIHPSVHLEGGTSNFRAGMEAVIGLAAVVIIAKFILELTLVLTTELNLRPFIVGLLFFSIGTNLPELTLTFRSWQSQARDLSLGNLIGSAFANILVVGFLAFLRPIVFTVGPAYLWLCSFLVALVAAFIWFAYTERRLSWREGLVLIVFYLAFVVVQVRFIAL
ncbi:MAG: hypothetical protein HY974_00550 [Candidatus Kerfeldbacteria bacterium]|nr:hypothetical protein [Candidatus Kerfeldbacteria bacterium]